MDVERAGRALIPTAKRCGEAHDDYDTNEGTVHHDLERIEFERDRAACNGHRGKGDDRPAPPKRGQAWARPCQGSARLQQPANGVKPAEVSMPSSMRIGRSIPTTRQARSSI